MLRVTSQAVNLKYYYKQTTPFIYAFLFVTNRLPQKCEFVLF